MFEIQRVRHIHLTVIEKTVTKSEQIKTGFITAMIGAAVTE